MDSNTPIYLGYSAKRKIRGSSKENHDAHQGGLSTKRKMKTVVEDRESKIHPRNFLDNFNSLKDNGKLTDFIIEIAGEEIPVHRAALAAGSKYFEAMFSHATVENETGRVKLYGMDAVAVKLGIEYLYTGRAKFSCDGAENFIHATELLQLTDLTDMYFEFLKEKIDIGNCLKYVALAETYNRRSFEDFFRKFSEENFVSIVASDQLKDMSESLLEQCLKSVPGDFLEVLKFQAIVKWTNEQSEKRSAFPKLMRLVKLELLPTDFYREHVLTEPVVRDSHECKDLILEMFVSPTPQTLQESDTKVTCIIALHSVSRMLHSLNVETENWSRVGRITQNMFDKMPEIFSVRGQIYLSSGDGFYQFSSGRPVSVGPPTGIQPKYHQCILRNECAYIVRSDYVGRFNPRKNTWNLIRNQLNLGDGFFVANSSTHMYAMGGCSTLKTAKEFDFHSKTWEPIENMNCQRSHGAAVWFNAKVYALGGVQGSGSWPIEFYSPKMNLWTNVSQTLQCFHQKCKAFAIGDKVYVVGGVSNTNTNTNTNRNCRGCCCSCHGRLSDANRSEIHGNIVAINLKNNTCIKVDSIKIDSGLSCVVQAN